MLHVCWFTDADEMRTPLVIQYQIFIPDIFRYFWSFCGSLVGTIKVLKFDTQPYTWQRKPENTWIWEAGVDVFSIQKVKF